jgi:hypothetical protein
VCVGGSRLVLRFYDVMIWRLGLLDLGSEMDKITDEMHWIRIRTIMR